MVAGIMVGSRDCYCLCLARIMVFTDVLLTNSYHYFIFYILLCLILSFVSYNRIAAGGSLTLAYLHPLNTTNERGKLERSDKLKINSTSKSCRRFLNYFLLALFPKVRLNLGLLGKKLTILQSVIRIEGINPFSGAVAGEAISLFR